MARSRKQAFITVLILILILGLLLPPYFHINRYREDLANLIGAALGRPVTMTSVSLRLLPQPGFDIQNFAVADQPDFSAEPLLAAADVKVNLRLASLWRGHLEVARINLSTPSLNLVHRADGHWNIEGLFLRASQVPSAPTPKQRVEARPRFPYISCDRGRINFKQETEKKAITLADANFAFWLAREDQWEFRLSARPVRTDEFLSDTGAIKLTGTLNRANTVGDTPVDIRYQWQGLQLGQFSKLLDGKDHGWRGGMALSGTASGTAKHLNLTANFSVSDFRRYDISPSDSFAWQAICAGHFSSTSQAFDRISCHLPAESGYFQITGSAGLPHSSSAMNLIVSANLVPASFLARLLRHMKAGVTDSLRAAGELSGAFSIQDHAELSGSVLLRNLRLRSADLSPEMSIALLRVVAKGKEKNDAPVLQRSKRSRDIYFDAAQPKFIELLPVSLPLGGAFPAHFSGSFGREGYRISLAGDVQIDRLLVLARIFGFYALKNSVAGMAKIALKSEGKWAGYQPPMIVGSADLKNVVAEVPGIAEKLTVTSANLSLDPEQAIWSGSATFEDTDISASGRVALKRGCSLESDCVALFDLQSDNLDIDQIADVLREPGRERRWFVFPRSEITAPAFLTALQARGTFTAPRVLLEKVALHDVSSQVTFAKGHAEFSNVKTNVFDGTHNGRIIADFTGKEPFYRASGALQQLALDRVSTALHNDFLTGISTVHYDVQFQGTTAEQIATSLAGVVDFTVTSGAMKHFNNTAKTITFARSSGTARIEHKIVTLENSTMELPGMTQDVTGTFNFGRELNLTLTSPTERVHLSGTFDSPRLSREPIAGLSASR